MSQSIVLKGTAKVPGATSSQTVAWTGDASYPNPSGYVITPAQLNMTRFARVIAVRSNVATGAWDVTVAPTYDATGDYITSVAIHLIVQTTGVEVANAVNVATAALTLYAEGN